MSPRRNDDDDRFTLVVFDTFWIVKHETWNKIARRKDFIFSNIFVLFLFCFFTEDLTCTGIQTEYHIKDFLEYDFLICSNSSK